MRGDRAAEKFWRQRLQRVSMRTKIVVPMVVLAMVPALLVGFTTVFGMQSALRRHGLERIEFDTVTKATGIQGFLASLQEDLLYLSQIDSIRALATAPSAAEPAVVGNGLLRGDAERELLLFARAKRAYCGVRCVSRAGHELVRLDVRDGEALAAQELLSRGATLAALPLPEPGRVAVSTRHSDGGDRGAPSLSHRGIVRYTTPVVGNQEGVQARLVIDICIGHTLSRIGELPPGVEAWLVDEGGIYLGYRGDRPAGFETYDLEAARPLSRDFSPRLVSAIMAPVAEQGTIKTEDKLVSWAPIDFDLQRPDRHWILLVSYPLAPLEAPVRGVTGFLSILVGLLTASAGVIGLFVAHYLSRPVDRLRRATREIAAGNLTRPVEITTGDELESLADDFNTMTRRLQEAQDRLAGWNVRLEGEVARQTERLHQLQSGLARTDKLATIGQMTAGVLHEVGNPLAAFKTKIQVAQEEAALCQNCVELLPELLTEVDRLAAFLRSFSRMARVPEPVMKEVVLSEVVNGVITLVTPELTRRGTTLDVESGADVPTIRGDADQLRQLVINLLLNAAEASSDGSEVVIRIKRAAVRDEPATPSRAVIEVVDEGAGISAEGLRQIWDPFYSTKPEGTGLGLAICRQIVHHHHGTIEIESELGSGTVVTLTFPAAVTAADKEPAP
ncbi:MAG: PAS domain-containing sensor histidine kinase [Thermoanaerobaculia bacterium]